MKQPIPFTIPYPKGFIHPGEWRFSIGTYCGKRSVCVTLHCGNIMDEDYKSFHLHDYFGFVPRFVRIGFYVLILTKIAEKHCEKFY